MARDLRLPELGENVHKADILSVLVEPGQRVEKDQPILEIGTDKATIEVPSEFSGVVLEVLVAPGTQAKVGQVVLRLEEEAAPPEPSPVASASAPTEEPPPPPAAEPAPPAVEPPPARAQAPVAAPGATPGSPAVASPVVAPRCQLPASGMAWECQGVWSPRTEPDAGSARRVVPASPSVRRIARELGLDITEVQGTGPRGRIQVPDLMAHNRKKLEAASRRPTGLAAALEAPELPDFTRWGEVERQEMDGVRRATARGMSRAWNQIPHVTQFDQADVTELEILRRRYADRVRQAGGKLTMTAILLKVLASALKTFPQFNASLDIAGEAVLYKKYFHLGVAVDTERGLMVPVVRDVDQKNLVRISVDLAEMAEKARARKLRPEDMQGACMTITNLGGIGGTAFTPIVNWPEVAILGLSRTRVEPTWIDGAFQPRTVLPLSLSYDHRLIDGADGARFLRWVCEALENPFQLLLEG